MSVLENFKKFFVEKYNNFPQGKYVSIVLIRKTQSEAIFRTEGSGEPLVREYVKAGKNKSQTIARSVISKRKQTAVERRTGRELLRNFNLLTKKIKDAKGKETELTCTLNTNKPCEKCIDCMVYGFAVGGAGAQKSRVITEDAFSILPINFIIDTRTFNATYDNGTMRNPLTGEASTSLGSSEYIKPETHYVDIEVLKDVTKEDLLYVIGNILRSSRYGAMTAKIGRIDNTIVKIIFSDTEIFSTLELTQAVYDQLIGDSSDLDLPLKDTDVLNSVKNQAESLMKSEIVGQVTCLSDAQLEELNQEVKKLYSNPEDFLKKLDSSYEGV